MARAFLYVAALCLLFAVAANGEQPDCTGGQCRHFGSTLRGLARNLLRAPDSPNCPAGQYLQLLSGKCKKCSPGRAKNVTGAGSCLPCRWGEYAAGEGNTACSKCEAGSYSNYALPKSCTPCPAGSFAAAKGSARCIPCFENSYSSRPGAKECIKCARGTSTKGKSGATSCS